MRAVKEDLYPITEDGRGAHKIPLEDLRLNCEERGAILEAIQAGAQSIGQIKAETSYWISQLYPEFYLEMLARPDLIFEANTYLLDEILQLRANNLRVYIRDDGPSKFREGDLNVLAKIGVAGYLNNFHSFSLSPPPPGSLLELISGDMVPIPENELSNIDPTLEIADYKAFRELTRKLIEEAGLSLEELLEMKEDCQNGDREIEEIDLMIFPIFTRLRMLGFSRDFLAQ